MPSEINYAIGGTVNYRTLEPTRIPHETVSLGVDGYGGLTTAFRATGSTSTHRLDYALAFATDGTPGPLRDYMVAGSQMPLTYADPPYTINGQQVPQYPLGLGPRPPAAAAFTGLFSQIQFQEPMYVCCASINTGFNSKAELAKLRYNFSQQTALTVSYLGGQSFADQLGSRLVSEANIGNIGEDLSVFTPPPGYSGSIPAGIPVPFDLMTNNKSLEWQQQNLFQGELRTTIGPYTLLGRFYTGAVKDDLELGTKHPLTFTGAAYRFARWERRDVNTGNCIQADGSTVAPVMTFFNGQPATFGTGVEFAQFLTQDHLRGESLELDRSIGGNDYAVSLDRSFKIHPFLNIIHLSGLLEINCLPVPACSSRLHECAGT